MKYFRSTIFRVRRCARYVAALNFVQLKAMQVANVKADECPEVRLRLFIRDFMLMLLGEKMPSSQRRIMAHELADPTPALDKIVREAIAPLHKFMGELVREIIGDKARDERSNKYEHVFILNLSAIADKSVNAVLSPD